ncbi:MAG TPA: hypothetical protein VI384_06175 [Candidatus Dormibacteraeota bacterium]
MATTKQKASKVFTSAERDAMVARAKEVKGERGGQPDLEQECLDKIASLGPKDRAMGQKLHKLIKDAAPSLVAKTYYGMPAYATAGKEGKVVCWFKPAEKFKTRYATLGFSDAAKLDDGGMWPTEYALAQLTGTEEAKVAALIKRAAR